VNGPRASTENKLKVFNASLNEWLRAGVWDARELLCPSSRSSTMVAGILFRPTGCVRSGRKSCGRWCRGLRRRLASRRKRIGAVSASCRKRAECASGKASRCGCAGRIGYRPLARWNRPRSVRGATSCEDCRDEPDDTPDLSIQVQWSVADVTNQRVHGTTHEQAMDR
jgi:hypothetical protein